MRDSKVKAAQPGSEGGAGIIDAKNPTTTTAHNANGRMQEETEAVRVETEECNPLADGKSLADYAEQPIDPEQTLLGERYLCRGGALLFVGRSGMGKSSAAAQQDILWACGREAFGIVPAKPLRILGIQAENDDGDMSEMAGGVMHGLELTDEDIKAVRERTLYLRWFCSGLGFLKKLDKALAQAHRNGKPFDLVRIDPLHAFIGGDVRDTKLITEFCRNGLNPILFRQGCGSVVNHHTPKINYTSRPKMEGPEWIYAAAGCADLANWAREVLVLTDADEAGGVFRLIPSKRWRRIGWRDAEGIIERERFFAHAPHGGGICWLPATPEQLAGARARQGSGKPSALLKIASMDASVLHAHAARIVEAGPLVATDFKAGVMREFRINERDAREVVKMLTDGNGKPIQVHKIGKTSWHGTQEQLAELKAPRLAEVR